jgi:serine/threonine protein phosphatase PrpC
MTLRACVKTDVGKKRANNEDAFYVNEARGIFAIADGMGGHKAGEVASRLAIEEIGAHLEGLKAAAALDDLRRAIELANRTIFLASQADPSLENMGTTVVVAAIEDGRLLLAHVGDSRAYLFTDSGLARVTADHSFVYEMIREGEITEEEARAHPMRGVLLRALGMYDDVEIEARELPYRGELLLLCTDGLTDMLRDREIEKILVKLPNAREVCDFLVAKANEAGGRDNITVITVRKVL